MGPTDNGSFPAMPSGLASTPDGSIYGSFDKSFADSGLSKREYFALHILAALIQTKTHDLDRYAYSVNCADELLAELSK